MNEEYIKELHKLYDTNVEEKIRKVENGIKKSIQEYELEDVKEFPNLHYNYLFKAYSIKYSKYVVVKIILDTSLDNEEVVEETEVSEEDMEDFEDSYEEELESLEEEKEKPIKKKNTISIP